MTIFHTLKYQITDVTKQDQLDPLPKEVVAKWRLRVEDYAIEQAKSVVHLDATGMAQKCIDAIYLYRDGKITRDELSAAAAYAATYAAAGAAYYAAYYAANAAAGADWYKAKQESLDLFKKWLIEELYNFEMDEVTA